MKQAMCIAMAAAIVVMLAFAALWLATSGNIQKQSVSLGPRCYVGAFYATHSTQRAWKVSRC